MAIAFRAVGTTSKVASGNMSPGLPAGHALNDILILLTNQADTVSCSVSGWTNISALTASFGAGNLNHQEVWAIRDNGSVSAPTVTHASGSVSNAIIAAFSGVDPGLTVGAAGAGSIFRDAQKQTGTSATTFTAPALTGVISGDMRIFLGQFSVADTSGATTNNWGTVSGFTEDSDDCSSLGGANAASFGIDHLLASGSAGSITSAVGWVGSTTSTTPQFWAWQCSQLALSSDASGGVTVRPNLFRPTVVGPTSRAFRMMQRLPVIPATAVDVTIALTGVSATSAVGSLGVLHDNALSGVSSTTAAGTLAPSTTVALTGASSTSSAGSLAPKTTATLTGVSSTMAAGTLVPSTTVALTGAASTMSVGSVAPSFTLILSGVGGTTSVGTMAPSTTIGLLGVTATGHAGTLVASGGDVTPTNASEIIFLLPSGKLAKRITDKIYEELG